jgi:hypothetical protein
MQEHRVDIITPLNAFRLKIRPAGSDARPVQLKMGGYLLHHCLVPEFLPAVILLQDRDQALRFIFIYAVQRMQPESLLVLYLAGARQYEIVPEPGILARYVKGLETHSRAKRLELPRIP